MRHARVVPLLLLPLLAGAVLAQEAKPLLAPALRQRVEQAIRTGSDWVRARQGPDGSVRSEHPQAPMGVASLAALALCACGDSIDDEPVRRALALARSIHDRARRAERAGAATALRTYEVSLALMAVVAAHRGEGGDPNRLRKLPPEMAAWVDDLADWLMGHRTTRTQGRIGMPRNQVSWGYPSGREDHSNAQFAVLGLGAALEAGARFEARPLLDVLRHFLAEQERRGPEVPRRVVEDGVEAAAKGGYVSGTVDRARGWGYLDNSAPTIAMTAGGVSTVILCRDACRARGLLDAVVDAAAQRAIDDGLAWLGTQLTFGGPTSQWSLYGLYAVERAAVLGRRRFLGVHDWYARGSAQLTGRQSPDGSWGGLVDTCFALLFLTRSTARGLRPEGGQTTPGVESQRLDLGRAGKLPDAEFVEVFRLVFAGWRRAPGTPGPRYSTAEVRSLGSRAYLSLLGLLEDADAETRRSAIDLLCELTGDRLGYEPYATPEARRAAIQRWRSVLGPR
jgi:hypothetical protein